MNSIRLALAIALTAGLIWGCGSDDAAPPTPTPADANTPASTSPAATDPASSGSAALAPAGDVTTQLRTSIEFPDFYPEDGPVYPGAKPSQAQQNPNGRVSLVFGTDASAEEAAGVMSEAAEAKGWTILAEDHMERGVLTRADKDGRSLSILTSRLAEGSSDSVTLVAISVDP